MKTVRAKVSFFFVNISLSLSLSLSLGFLFVAENSPVAARITPSSSAECAVSPSPLPLLPRRSSFFVTRNSVRAYEIGAFFFHRRAS